MARYITTADTAKLVRKALKAAFPGVTFSVRSKTYSGGSSISVHWTDGPVPGDVEGIAHQFAGSGFDGMIDCSYGREHWLTPDGRVILARCEGTTGQRGVIPSYYGPGDAPEPGAELVRFSANHVSCTRELSADYRRWMEGEIERATGRAFDGSAYYPSSECFLFRTPADVDVRCYPVNDQTYGADLVWHIAGCIGTPCSVQPDDLPDPGAVLLLRDAGAVDAPGERWQRLLSLDAPWEREPETEETYDDPAVVQLALIPVEGNEAPWLGDVVPSAEETARREALEDLRMWWGADACGMEYLLHLLDTGRVIDEVVELRAVASARR